MTLSGGSDPQFVAECRQHGPYASPPAGDPCPICAAAPMGPPVEQLAPGVYIGDGGVVTEVRAGTPLPDLEGLSEEEALAAWLAHDPGGVAIYSLDDGPPDV